MILERKPLTIAEVHEHIKKLEEAKEMKDYIKKFSKLSSVDAIKLIGEIEKLNNLKIKYESIIKIADTLPKESEEVNKIFTDVSLSEEEVNAILQITTRY